MHRPRFYKGLRITASAVFGILCVLLIVLCAFDFTGGMLAFYLAGMLTFYLAIDMRQATLILPYWLLALIAAALATAPWIRWSKRFSLRTQLIATTLVAVVLGLAVWSMR